MRKVFQPSTVSTPAGGLSRKDAAVYVGCSTRYLDQRVAAGELQRAKLGTRTVFLRSELDRFLQSRMGKHPELKRLQVGVIGVDSGRCWIGDPSYVLHQDKPPKDIGEDWKGFCAKILDAGQAAQFSFDLGHAGLGVCVSTGWGDGIYPVFAHIDSEGCVQSVTVEFIGIESDEEDA